MWQGDDERVLSSALTAALTSSILLDSFPKSCVEAYVLCIEDDGAVLATAITATSLALAHANVDLLDLVSAASVHWVREEGGGGVGKQVAGVEGEGRGSGRVVVDCDQTEEEHEAHRGRAVVAWMEATQAYTHIGLEGQAGEGAGGGEAKEREGNEGGTGWEALMDEGVNQCRQVLVQMRNCLRDGYLRGGTGP